MKSLAERLLAEEVPNNKVPDGKEFPEWDKAGTPPSQIEESHGADEFLMVDVGRLMGPGSCGMVEFQISSQMEPEAMERAILEAISKIQVPGIVGAEIHAR